MLNNSSYSSFKITFVLSFTNGNIIYVEISIVLMRICIGLFAAQKVVDYSQMNNNVNNKLQPNSMNQPVDDLAQMEYNVKQFLLKQNEWSPKQPCPPPPSPPSLSSVSHSYCWSCRILISPSIRKLHLAHANKRTHRTQSYQTQTPTYTFSPNIRWITESQKHQEEMQNKGFHFIDLKRQQAFNPKWKIDHVP